MGNLFTSLVEQFKEASLVSKATALMVALGLAAILGTSAYIAQRPHFTLLYGNLDAVESGRIAKALADAGIPFDLSQPPGPHNIMVDEGDRTQAMQVIASSGALEHAPRGITLGEGGMSSVFLSASERDLMVQKRQWEEAELLLEGLQFVSRASVRTSGGRVSAFGHSEARTGSVTLQLGGGTRLTRRQAETVADLVRYALRIEPENLMISDQSGNTVFSGADLDPMGGADDWLEQKLRHDRQLADQANELLAGILGPNKAKVSVNSFWNTDLSTEVRESANPSDRVIRSETSSSTKTPQFAPSSGVGAASAHGGVVGAAANLSSSNTAPAPAPSAAPQTVTAQTKDERKDYVVPTVTTQVVKTSPVLERLSVALFLDTSDENVASAAASLEESVQAAVGYEEGRDVFKTVELAFAPREEAPPEEAPSALASPMTQTLLRRGVEIVSALAFLFLILKGIKGAKQLAKEPAQELVEENEVMVEMLARKQVEDLMSSNPEKVGELLSSWARDEMTAGSAR